MHDAVYCYPNSHVLKNKHDIRDADILSIAERSLTTSRLTEIRVSPVKGDFNLTHLKSIHKKLFGDLYEWAGEIRKVNIKKGDTVFSPVMNIQQYASEISQRIAEDAYLLRTPKEKAIRSLAECMGDINALHPFREGNGRTQRQFVGDLAKVAGIHLRFEKANARDMMSASIESFSGNTKLFEKIFTEISEPLSIDEQRAFVSKVSERAEKVFSMLEKDGLLPDRVQEFNGQESTHSMKDWMASVENIRNRQNQSENKEDKAIQKSEYSQSER